MGRQLENLEQFGIDVVLERRRGFRACDPARNSLRLLVHLRTASFNSGCICIGKRILRERALGCLVISIGNLTVGGTGKTPVVEKFARALQVGGRRVAILSRGYKSQSDRQSEIGSIDLLSSKIRSAARCFRWKIAPARFAHRRRRALHARAQFERRDRYSRQGPRQKRPVMRSTNGKSTRFCSMMACNICI